MHAQRQCLRLAGSCCPWPAGVIGRFPSRFQIRTQVTQVKAPKTVTTSINIPVANSTDIKEQIDWSKVGLSEVTLPEHKFPEPRLRYEDGRTFYKHPLSRKVYLHTLFTNLLLRHPMLLFFNVNSVDFHTLIHLRIALAPYGANFKVIRRRIFIAALRVAEYVEASRTRPYEMWDPSGLPMHAKILPRRREIEELEMKALLKGNQTAAVYFDDFNWRPESIDTAKIDAVAKIIERTGKTPILGARFQRTVINAEDVKRLRSVKKVDQVRGELAGVLSGPTQTVAGILSAPAAGVAFTLEGRQKAMEEESGGQTAQQR